MRRLMMMAGALAMLTGSVSAARASQLPVLDDGAGQCADGKGQVCKTVRTEKCLAWAYTGVTVTLGETSGSASNSITCKTWSVREQTYRYVQ